MTTDAKAFTGQGRLPGDPDRKELLARIIRVDQAGEYGAVRIYEGQMSVLKRKKSASVIRKMAEAERRHLQAFDKMVAERRIRPTLLTPIWHVAGFALGAASAMLGEKAAMACTVAVEEVIDEHYANQAAQLGADEAELKACVEEFREEEIEHRDIALENGAEQAPAYPLLTSLVKSGSRLAIWLSERI